MNTKRTPLIFKALLAILLAAFLISPSLVQAQTVEAQQTSQDVTINQDNLSELIETLESETARTEFIQNLKTLQQTGQETAPDENTAPPAISEILGFNAQFESFTQRYTKFLQENNLSGSAIGKTALSLAVCVIFAFIAFLVQRGAFMLRDQLLRLKNRYSISHDRYRVYLRGLRYTAYTIVAAFFIFSLGLVWDLSDFSFVQSELFTSLFGNLLSIILIILIAITIWEIIDSSIELAMKSSSTKTNRLITLLPIVRNIAFIIFVCFFGLIMLSELGINIVPLIAGAGVFGIAVGFGAQTMVKDFLTGFTIILEDLVQVGDVASMGGKTGVIEKITMRKVQLRGLDGTVFTVPFSEISIVENMTKDYSFYLMDIGVAYRENTDQVIEAVREVDQELRADEDFGYNILDPIEILGVDQFADSAVIIKARIKTRPIKQWEVGREFNRRMKMKFDQMGIEIPFPHQTIFFGEDKQGKAPPAYIRLQDGKGEKASAKEAAVKKPAKAAKKSANKAAPKPVKKTSRGVIGDSGAGE